MRILEVRNVHEALPRGLELFRQHGIERDSRNGKVLQLDGPLVTIYSHPRERVLFHPWRDANPFFHFYESLWMLAGRNDVAPLARYVKRMATFSDDGKTFNAAYGWRWRDAELSEVDHYINGHPVVVTRGRDQLKIIAENLRKNPDSRQEVLQIWDHERDLGTQTKDHACNLSATFQVRPGVDPKSETPWILDMVVFCRSNDMIWGGWGANAVHFSMLHEYVARRAFMAVGSYTQISVNAHIYVDRPDTQRCLNESRYPYVTSGQPYPTGDLYPLMQGDADRWDSDCRHIVREDGRIPSGLIPGAEPFWADVAWPIIYAHDIYKDRGSIGGAIDILLDCKAPDWRQACTEWLQRRWK